MAKSRPPVSSRIDKIIWLLEHQDLWIGFPSGVAGDPRYKEIVDKMKEDELISNSTYWPDVKLHKLISEARKMRREGKWKKKEITMSNEK